MEPMRERSLRNDRKSPVFLVFYEGWPPIASSSGIDPALLSDPVRALIATGLARLDVTESSFVERIDAETMLRFVKLRSADRSFSAVFFESTIRRTSVEKLIADAELTKREVEVLFLILRSYSTAEIAAELVISESTVADHMKRINRKTQCTRRSELFARAFDMDDLFDPSLLTMLPKRPLSRASLAVSRREAQ